MSRAQKILLSIPSFLGLFFLIALFIPPLGYAVYPSFDIYKVINKTFQLLVLIQLIILIRRLWRFKNLEKSAKWNWTALLIFFNAITGFIYIWKKDSQFVDMDKNTNETLC